MIDKELYSMLSCPACKNNQDFIIEEENLRCPTCSRVFSVESFSHKEHEKKSLNFLYNEKE